jgi:methionyl-tRNA formyltransferase
MTLNPSIILIGSVNSSKKTLEKLIEHKLNVEGVLGLSPLVSKTVSGYVDLQELAMQNAIPFSYFEKVNSQQVLEFISEKKPDLVFVIGLSQLIKKELLAVPTHGTVGYHPTKLPQGRGRGAIAWMILENVPTAVTFFLMDEGMDSGPIWTQEPFEITETDYAQDVIDKIVLAIGNALDRVLPNLKNGTFSTSLQDEENATYLGKRNPEDGLIDWNASAKDIHKLIRATSCPLPGAYTYLKLNKITVMRASVVESSRFLGVPGRIILADTTNGTVVQTGSGLIRLEHILGWELEDLKVGHSLGFNFERAFFDLRKEIEEIKINNGKD